MLLAIISSLFVIFVLYILKKRNDFFQIRGRIGLNGPEPHFLLGNLKQIIESKRRLGYDNSYQWREELHAKFGDKIGIYLGRQLNICVTEEEDVKEIFIKNFSTFSDRIVPPIFDETKLTTSLLQSTYARGWKHTRTAVAPIFSTVKMKMMHETINSKVDVFLEVLRAKSETAKKFDIYEDFQALTLDVIGKCAFAIDSNCQTDRNEVFYVQARKFVTSTDIGHSPIITFSFILPELKFLWKILYRFTDLCASEFPLVDGLSNVYDRRKLGEGAEFDDLLKLLIDKEEDKNKSMSKQEIIENCYAFLLAGYETTSTAMTYCSYLLSKNRDVQQKLYEEVRSVKEEQRLTYDTIHSMQYLDAVFKETLRVYPPVVHFVNRQCSRDIMIRGQFYPKGSVVSVLPYTVHMNENNWRDAKKFIPERFLNWNDKGSLKWIPFGVGPRYCVGMRFAEMEFKTTIARLVDNFELSMAENDTMIPNCTGVIMRPKDPLYIQLRKRRM